MALVPRDTTFNLQHSLLSLCSVQDGGARCVSRRLDGGVGSNLLDPAALGVNGEGLEVDLDVVRAEYPLNLLGNGVKVVRRESEDGRPGARKADTEEARVCLVRELLENLGEARNLRKGRVCQWQTRPVRAPRTSQARELHSQEEHGRAGGACPSWRRR